MSPNEQTIQNSLSRSQTIDNVGHLLWAWFSFLRKSADEIVEPWHTSLLTPRQWRQQNGRRWRRRRFYVALFFGLRNNI